MFIAVSSRTTAGAKRFVEDRGIDLRPFRRRESLIDISRRWASEREARARRTMEAFEAAADRARKRSAEMQRLQIEPEPTPASRIVAQVACWHRVTVADIMGSNRARSIVAARMDAIAAVYVNCRLNGERYSLHKLGQAFNRDHTTALHSLRKRGLR